MTSRTYDIILSVSNASNFTAGNNIVGNTTGTTGTIAAVDKINNKLKVKLANLLQEFSATEFIHSNVITLAGTANGYIHSASLPFQANTMSGNTTTGRTQITGLAPSTFIAEKNAFTQNPVVRLYSIYYPGEWYPPNANGNPTGQGAGYAWPAIFPLRFAEIVGDLAQDVSYNVSYGGVSYVPYPVNVSGLEQASDGKINELSLTVYNTDNLISYLVENPYLAGVNLSNSVYATVNGELVRGIDPRTVEGDPESFSNTLTRDSMQLARDAGLVYDANIVAYYETANAAFDKIRSDEVGGTWQQQKMDTRDLLGAAVEIKTTFANFLDYWPEYGKVVSGSNATLNLTSTLPYRVGDTVQLASNAYNKATITYINSDTSITVNRPLAKYLYLGTSDTTPHAITFKPDGTKMYMAGTTNDRIYEYNLPNTWDISTAQLSQFFSVGNQQSAPTGVRFDTDGTYMYIVGTANANIHRYTLSTAWNVTTATLSQNFALSPGMGAADGANVQGLAIDALGSNVYVVNSTNNLVHQFNLAIAWNLGTASFFASKGLGVGATSSRDIEISLDSSKLYSLDATTDRVSQFSLEDTANVSSAVFTGNVYLGFIDSTPSAAVLGNDGYTLYYAGTSNDNVFQIPLSVPGDITTADYAPSFVGQPIHISNPLADTSSYLIDNYKIDQLEGLSENIATFGLVSWLQYFKIVTPKRKYYKNTCQWVYKGDECQYPGPGGLPIPGSTAFSPTYGYDVNNEPSFQLAPSLINMSSWTVGTGSVTGYTAYGDGNSRLVDSTPYGDLGVVWDVSNQDSASNADGGWDPSTYPFAVDETQKYRFSVWIRRKVVGNGTSVLGAKVTDSIGVNQSVFRRTDGTYVATPSFVSASWWGINRPWYLVVGHIWPAGSGTGAVDGETGIYDTSGSKIATAIDFVWDNIPSMKTGLRAYLDNSTNTTTNQQFYDPRINITGGNTPTIQNLLTYSPALIASRVNQDVCAKSLAACSLRNNSIHFGGFPGVGRTVPQM